MIHEHSCYGAAIVALYTCYLEFRKCFVVLKLNLNQIWLKDSLLFKSNKVLNILNIFN